MIHTTIPIHVEGSQPYARLVTYIQEYTSDINFTEKPLVILCPGGAYRNTAAREAELLAIPFLNMGYHTAILYYSCAPSRYPAALCELATAIKISRENATQWHVNPDKILVLGCSAGGHLAASMGMFWNSQEVAEWIGINRDAQNMIRPDGMILCYPVITMQEFTHVESKINLLGEKYEDPRLVEKLTLYKQVSESTPQAFVWHTFEDEAVPVENSLQLVVAMRKAGIPVEFHLYPKGRHGLSLASRLTEAKDGRYYQPECKSWISLVRTWIEAL